MNHDTIPVPVAAESFPNSSAANYLYQTENAPLPAGNTLFRELDPERRPESEPTIVGHVDGNTSLHLAGPMIGEQERQSDERLAEEVASRGLMKYVRAGLAKARNGVASFATEMQEVFAPMLPNRSQLVTGTAMAGMAIMAGVTTAYITGNEERVGLPPKEAVREHVEELIPGMNERDQDDTKTVRPDVSPAATPDFPLGPGQYWETPKQDDEQPDSIESDKSSEPAADDEKRDAEKDESPSPRPTESGKPAPSPEDTEEETPPVQSPEPTDPVASPEPTTPTETPTTDEPTPVETEQPTTDPNDQPSAEVAPGESPTAELQEAR